MFLTDWLTDMLLSAPEKNRCVFTQLKLCTLYTHEINTQQQNATNLNKMYDPQASML